MELTIKEKVDELLKLNIIDEKFCESFFYDLLVAYFELYKVPREIDSSEKIMKFRKIDLVYEKMEYTEGDAYNKDPELHHSKLCFILDISSLCNKKENIEAIKRGLLNVTKKTNTLTDENNKVLYEI